MILWVAWPTLNWKDAACSGKFPEFLTMLKIEPLVSN